MEKLRRIRHMPDLRSRVSFAALTYLGIAVLLLSWLEGIVFTTPGPQVAAQAPIPSPTEQLAAPQSVSFADSQPESVTAPTDVVPTPQPTAIQDSMARPRARTAKVSSRPAPAISTQVPVLQNVQIHISDAGISPHAISIAPGGTVTWVNDGSAVHTATATPGSPFHLDTGGLAAGQVLSVKLFDPGNYRFTSAPDCLPAPTRRGFDCSAATITVLPPPRPSASAAPVGSSDSNQEIHITDLGFVPDSVSVKANDSLTWTNQGSSVHTATAISGGKLFDSGGLAPHQSANITFSSPGTYTYSSAPDCLYGNKSPAFHCAGTFTVVVRG